MNVTDERFIFPTLVNKVEHTMLRYLSTCSGLSMSAVVRELILREMATRQLAHGGYALRQTARSLEEEPTR